MEYEKYLERYLSSKSKYQAFIKGLKKKKRGLDELFHEAHDASFEEIDCLKCANCCSTISPIFKQRDVERLSKVLKLKPYQFIELYLHEDEDGDFVLNNSPCPFLLADKYCAVYEQRPVACRDFPHTHHVNMKKYLSLAIKNCTVCPAVVKTIMSLEEKLNNS